MRELQRLLSKVRQAVDSYSMIIEGDKIAVGVSGGKDSLAMLCALGALRDFYPASFEVIAVTIDPAFQEVSRIGASEADYSLIEELCRRLRVKLIIERTQIAPIVFDHRQESNPCSLCARLRRAALTALAEKTGANKLALGHHRDDAAQTILMNLFNEGRLGCFSPVTALEDRKISVIRPMVLCSEREISAFAIKAALPVLESPCPMDKGSNRARIGELIRELDRENPGVAHRIVGAFKRSETDGWHE